MTHDKNARTQDSPIVASAVTRQGYISKNVFWFAMIGLTLAVAIVLPSCNERNSQQPASASNDRLWLDASEKAEQTGRPILIDFTADWCPPCKVMNKDVLPKPAVQALLNEKFVFVTADVTSPQSSGSPLSNHYGITAIPTFMILDPQGKIIDKRVGGMSADQFAQWLTQASSDYTPAASNQPGSSPQPDQVDQPQPAGQNS